MRVSEIRVNQIRVNQGLGVHYPKSVVFLLEFKKKVFGKLVSDFL